MAITYGVIFQEQQYISIALRAAEYFRESAKAATIPLIETTIKDAMQYRYRAEGDPDVSYGTHQWSSGGIKAQSKLGYEDYDINAIEMELMIPNSKVNLYNSENFLAEAYDQQIRKWISDIDDSAFHGVLGRNPAVHLNEGILGSVTTTENLSSGADEDLSTKGEIYLAIKKMIELVPFRVRENLPSGVDVFVTSNLDGEVRNPDRIYQDKVESDFVYENLIGPKASPALKIRNYIVTDKILALATDDTSGVNADTADTQGTHDRILVIAPDSKFCARVVSLWDMIGEEQLLLNVHQAWGYRGRAVVFDTNGVKYSEALTV